MQPEFVPQYSAVSLAFSAIFMMRQPRVLNVVISARLTTWSTFMPLESRPAAAAAAKRSNG
jgi:hypothetical protein